MLKSYRIHAGEPEEWRSDIEKAIKLASVFDDGGDGADDESARGVVSILNKLLTTPIKADDWIKCSERLPVDGDGHIWIFDDRGRLVLGPYEWDMLEPDMGETHWMPTGLVMPDMPKQEPGK